MWAANLSVFALAEKEKKKYDGFYVKLSSMFNQMSLRSASVAVTLERSRSVSFLKRHVATIGLLYLKRISNMFTKLPGNLARIFYEYGFHFAFGSYFP